MIILVGTEKGGSGKSTIAINLASYFANEGKDVVLVDADSIQTSHRWVLDRDQNTDLPTIHCIQKYDNITKTLKDLDKRYEYVIVDVAGRDSRELRTGLLAAHLLLIPFIPSNADLDVIYHFEEHVITPGRDLNEGLVVRGVLSKAPTNPSIHEAAEAREFLKDFPAIELARTIIRERKVHRDMLAEGRGVIEMPRNKAAAEIQLLGQEIKAWLNVE